MSKTLFQKIMDREIPARIAHEDDHCIAIHDINPAAPLHLLVIPRKPMAKLSDAVDTDQAVLGHLLLVARKLALDAGYPDFRININNGAGAGQTVFHLHIHVLGGRPFRWPPG